MKKFLTMFAFAAAIVFGAFTLASCGDDEETGDVFKVVFELKTQNEKVRNSELFAKNAKMLSDMDEEYRWSDSKAEAAWDLLVRSHDDLQDDIDKAAKALDDPTLSCTVKYLKNGQTWKFMTVVTTYVKTSIDF